MSPQITCRKANLSDVNKLSILFQQVYIHTYGVEGVSDEFANYIIKQFSTERLQGTISTNPDNLAVADYNNNLVGVVELGFDNKCPIQTVNAPELNKLYILEWFSGQGIGYKLLGEAENVVKSYGISEMWLRVLGSNQRAVSFYEKQNYKWIGNEVFEMEKNSYDNKIMLKKF